MSAEAYATYERLLRQLHELSRRDEDEGPEAEAIRDQMDQPWNQMTSDEKERVCQLSTDLWAELDAETRAKS